MQIKKNDTILTNRTFHIDIERKMVFEPKKRMYGQIWKKKYMNVNEKKKSAINTQHHDQI